MATARHIVDDTENPLEVVEELASAENWQFDRSADDELTLTVAGSWADYYVCFNWHEELEGLHLACTFDMVVPDHRRAEVSRLMTLINEELWLGHFDLWKKEGAILYRNGLLLSGSAEVTQEQCETLLRLALDVSERYYPAFQFVMWSNKNADEAIAASLLDPAGQA